MSNSEDKGHIFSHKPDGQLYLVENGSSLTSAPLYSPDNHNTLHVSNQKGPLHLNSIQHRSSSVNSPSVFVLSPSPSSQDVQTHLSVPENVYPGRHSIDSMDNISLTSWTTKFSNQSFPIASPNIDALTPLIPHQQSPLPTATGPIHLKTRMHKVTPYHNAFSRLSPLQSKTFNGSHHHQYGTPSHHVVSYSSKDEMSPSISSKENRFKRTAEALQKSGLWDIAMKTGHLIKRNQELQKELEQFKMDALNFLKSVIKNPENRDFIKSVLNTALHAGASESKKSVMTVVVSAAAAVAAVSVSDSVSCNIEVNSKGKSKTKVGEQSPSSEFSPDSYCSISKEELVDEKRTSVV